MIFMRAWYFALVEFYVDLNIKIISTTSSSWATVLHICNVYTI